MGNLTSVDTYLLSLKPMARLKKFFTEAVNSYFQEVYQPKFDVELRITQTWANYSERGMFHHYHAHPNSFVSGVFYVQTNESDKIFFNKNIYENIQIPTENFNLFNSMSWWFPAEVNNLLMFPSGLHHNVPEVSEEHTRISISFNTFPQGILGNIHNLTECKL
jgi:uncharacterized protein (TIGR02466 family)